MVLRHRWYEYSSVCDINLKFFRLREWGSRRMLPRLVLISREENFRFWLLTHDKSLQIQSYPNAYSCNIWIIRHDAVVLAHVRRLDGRLERRDRTEKCIDSIAFQDHAIAQKMIRGSTYQTKIIH